MQLPRQFLFLLLLLVAGCAGGSGSSGFDISPTRERENIDTAIRERRCVVEDGLSICPAGESFESIPSVPSGMDPSPALGLTIVPQQIDINSCRAGICEVRIELVRQGLPTAARYQLAVRSASDDPWNVGVSLATDELDGGLDSEATVPEGSVSLEIAVLVYLSEEPIAPGTIATLHESGAELVFVSRK